MARKRHTWSNRTIYRKLDHVSATQRGYQNWPDLEVEAEETGISDHMALKVEFRKDERPSRKSFRYQNHWRHLSSYTETVEEAWRLGEQLSSDLIKNFLLKMEQVKGALRTWARNTWFVSDETRNTLEEDLKSAKLKMIEKGTLYSKLEYQKSVAEWKTFLRVEADFLKQKNRIRWALEGEVSQKIQEKNGGPAH